ncbi:c-type cytochrome [Corallibacter sp.]|uniref:c-type cytochrome n=1 Tax=Corallibacter sp. TaxID=2038084 RepID=UPI003AB33212
MLKNISLIIIVLLLVTSCKNTNSKQDLAINNTQDPELKSSIQRGKTVYSDFCVSCHMPNGKGVPKAFPPLAKSDFLKNNQEKSIHAIKYGLTGKITVNGITYNSAMVPLGLSDSEIADVMNYINNAWENNISNIVTTEKVSKIQR